MQKKKKKKKKGEKENKQKRKTGGTAIELPTNTPALSKKQNKSKAKNL